MNVDEVEFLAEDTLVSIVPSFKLSEPLEFVSGKFGPFTPSVPTQVPLWLAIQLKKANRCRIKVPDWMQLERLQDMYRQEQEDESFFKPIATHYLEVAALLLQHAEKDIANTARIRSVLADIESVRMNKIREGLKKIQTGTTFIKLNNISCMELNNIHPFCSAALNEFHRLGAEDDEDEAALAQPPPPPPQQQQQQQQADAVSSNANAAPAGDSLRRQQRLQQHATAGRGMHLRARAHELLEGEQAAAAAADDNNNNRVPAAVARNTVLDDVEDDDDDDDVNMDQQQQQQQQDNIEQPVRKLRRFR